MASSEAMRRKRLEKLPADFNDWDDKEPPSTLPPDFLEFDSSAEGEEQEPVVVQPVMVPVQQASSSKAGARETSTVAVRETPNLSVPRAHLIETEIQEEEPQKKSRKGIIIGAIGATVVLSGVGTFLLLKRSPTKVPTVAHVTLPAPALAPTPSIAAGEKPAPGKPVTSDAPASTQSDNAESAPQQPQKLTVDTATMQNQLNAPSRISSDLKKPAQPDAPPAGGFTASGLDSGNTLGATRLFADKSGPRVRPDIPSRVEISTAQAMEMLTRKTDPVFPSIAKSARVSGTVKVQILVGKDGTVQSLHVVDGPRLLQSAATDAVKSWRFRPYTISNQTVEMQTTVNILFKLGQ